MVKRDQTFKLPVWESNWRKMFFFSPAGTNILTYEPSREEGGAAVRDPCFHYTVLDQAWRATNTSTKFKMCDRNVKWKGEVSVPQN